MLEWPNGDYLSNLRYFTIAKASFSNGINPRMFHTVVEAPLTTRIELCRKRESIAMDGVEADLHMALVSRSYA
jgi:hypothetical protein